MWGADSPSTRTAACERHLKAWQTHESLYGLDSVRPIKAIHTDPVTGEQTIIGYAEWYFYPTALSGDDKRPPHPLTDPDSASPEKRAVVHEWLDPIIDSREKFVGHKPFGMLMYMCVDPKWRRRGASTMCVKWGMNRCDELGIPGWLEASEQGKLVYERLGWEVVGQIKCPGMEFPGMMYWPKGWHKVIS